MTNEQLMAPRYRVIANYPYSPFEVNMVLEVEKDGELYSKDHGYVASKSIVKEEQAKKLSNIFRKLKWYECRKETDMPEYMIVVAETVNHLECKGIVIKTSADVFWNSNKFSFDKEGFVDAYGGIYIEVFEPATEKQYLDYKSKWKKSE